jgi:hypothetical protein
MGNGALAIGPKLPRPSSTLPTQSTRNVSYHGEYWSHSGRAQEEDGLAHSHLQDLLEARVETHDDPVRGGLGERPRDFHAVNHADGDGMSWRCRKNPLQKFRHQAHVRICISVHKIKRLRTYGGG